MYGLIKIKDPKMQETRIAKFFQTGASQAVRLPAEFRFAGIGECLCRYSTLNAFVSIRRNTASAY
jgi:hypothetical protein